MLKLNFKHTQYQPTPVYRSKITSPGPKIIIKMSSVMSFVFNAVELCVVTINEIPWTRAREVCRAPGYGKAPKTAHVIKAHASPENYAHKWQLSSVSAVGTPINWPKDSQKKQYLHQ